LPFSLSLVIVFYMFLIGRYSAHHNFEDYVCKVEMERLNELADSLGQKSAGSRPFDAALFQSAHDNAL
jgi:hypothetical protein